MKRWHRLAAVAISAGLYGAMSAYFRHPPRAQEVARPSTAPSGSYSSSLEDLFAEDNMRAMRDRAATEATATSAPKR